MFGKRNHTHKDGSGSGTAHPANPESDQQQDEAQLLDDEILTKLNLGGKLASMFIDSKTTLLIMVAALAFGLLALFVTPREENPQISVPSVNVIVPFPGASPQEIENLISQPLERYIWDIKGVEHVYSIAFPDFAVITAQFKVGEDQEASVYKVFETVNANLDKAPQGIMTPLVKPIDINDVPIVAFTLFSEQQSSFELRQLANKLMNELRQVSGTGESIVVGGNDRQITVAIDPVKSAAYAIDPKLIAEALAGANLRLPTDSLESGQERILVRTGQFLRNAEDVGSVVVATHQLPDGSGGELVYLRDIAEVTDGPGEITNFSRLLFGRHSIQTFHGSTPVPPDLLIGRSWKAVTIAIAKQKGTNSVTIAEALLERMDELGQTELSSDVGWVVTRNDGQAADHAVNELMFHLTWAIIIVVGLLVVFLGWRDAGVVAIAIPITMLTTLAIGLLAGQTINRITLFALILSLGLLVDDAIVVVENIHRHLKMRKPGQSVIQTCILSVNEIANPTIYATLVVVVSMVPMAFVTGMMGPYMGPIPFNVPIAMLISLLVAFKISPYLSLRWLKVKPDPEAESNDDGFGAPPRLLAIFNRVLGPLLDSRTRRNTLLAVLIVLLIVCFTFPMLKWVKFRMLPKRDATTLLVTVDLPAGSSLNHTDELVRNLEDRIVQEDEITQLVTTVGTGSVIDFNGLLRGTSFRTQPHQADIRVNIIDKKERDRKSERLVLDLRPDLQAIADPYGAIIKLVEDPPGPPVRATVLAEIYGPYGGNQRAAVAKVRDWFASTREVTDIDDTVSTVAQEIRVVVDEEKAMQAGLKVSDVAMSLRAALAGYPVTFLHDPAALTQIPITLRFPVEYRSRISDLANIVLPSSNGSVPLSEVTKTELVDAWRPVYHKDLRPVSYVYGEMGERSSVYANIDMMIRETKDPLPASHELVWEGEWDLTLKVFRDLGIAMMVAIMLIYLILVGRFRSFTDPIVLMGAVPLMMLGVLPGFALIGIWDVYFSATGMIGVIALAGIVVRNSIILIEFVKDAEAAGMPLREAVILAGAIRTRPIFLTAITAIAGMLTMISDPVWSGLSWALLFGIAASTPLSLFIIPMMYYLAHKNDPQVTHPK